MTSQILPASCDYATAINHAIVCGESSDLRQELTLHDIEGEPRIYDLDLARSLGFSQIRDIRKLIKRNEHKLLNFGRCATVARRPESGGTEFDEFYLNQKQAIFICMKSETDNAFEVQADIVRVYDRHLNGEPQSIRQLSPAEILIQQGQIMLALEHEQKRQAEIQKQLELRQESTERRLDQIETATDHFTIIGWHRYANMSGSLPIADAAKMGKLAANYCKDHDVEMGEVPDPRFGKVKTYPKWVLDDLFANRAS
jgi:hypothetical protein